MENNQIQTESNYYANIKKINSNKYVYYSGLNDQVLDEKDNCDLDSILVSLLKNQAREGTIIEGTIVRMDKDYVTIDAGLKSEGIVPIKEFELGDEQNIQVGAKTKVYLEKIEGRNGNIVISREKAIRDELWNKLEKAAADKLKIEGVIFSCVKCGYYVDVGSIVAFLPASHVDLRQVKDVTPLIGVKQSFYILKMDKKQGNIVVSRKLVLEESLADAKHEFINNLNEGDIIEGKVKSITNYGVFIGIHESPEVGVVDGLLYITDISWSRVSHPSACFCCGQTVKAKIINIDRENRKISLGVKQLKQNPWCDCETEKKYCVNSIHKGVITTMESYGFFVELTPGIEGLVHLSEISWTKNSLPINQRFIRGQEIDVKILSVDTNKNRMSLSCKQCCQNPWEAFLQKYSLGSTVNTKIKNISNTEISVSFTDNDLHPEIEGKIRLSELSWDTSLSSESLLKKYNVGDELLAKVLMVNTNKCKINLGVKQLEKDPFIELLNKVELGQKIPVSVSKVEDNGILVDVFNGQNYNFNVLIDQEHLSDKKFFPGDKVEAEILSIQGYNLILSLK